MNYAKDIDAAVEQALRDKRDAERYQWIRQHPDIYRSFLMLTCAKPSSDCWIDKYIAKEKL